MVLSCNNSSSGKINKIANYSKPTESFEVTQGLVVFDTLTANIKTHKIVQGDKFVFSYERTGLTVSDGEDWDLKYKETLVFQIDTTLTKFDFCDTDLKSIDCKYYWICYAKEIKKEIKNIKKGCINGYVSNDSIQVNIDINSEFGFGSFMEKDEKRKIKKSHKTALDTVKR